MDRNLVGCIDRAIDIVALRKESVDRNVPFDVIRPAIDVALRKESVDRNLYYGDDLTFLDGSLSARRAWIEISMDDLEPSTTRRSLSARRAWIEIAQNRRI